MESKNMKIEKKLKMKKKNNHIHDVTHPDFYTYFGLLFITFTMVICLVISTCYVIQSVTDISCLIGSLFIIAESGCLSWSVYEICKLSTEKEDKK